jgi:isopropylmalate/homocitrate/citramalate synthase
LSRCTDALVLPRRLQIDFSRVVQEAADASGRELAAAEIWRLFDAEYLSTRGPWVYRSHQLVASAQGDDHERITNIVTASLLAVLSAVNRATRLGVLAAGSPAERTGT